MKLTRHIELYFLLCALVLLSRPCPMLSQTSTTPSASGASQAAVERDGQHDFDFELGSWKIHLKRLEHPLTGSTKWVEFDGTSVTRKVWVAGPSWSSSKPMARRATSRV
jgi:hypothetical protein